MGFYDVVKKTAAAGQREKAILEDLCNPNTSPRATSIELKMRSALCGAMTGCNVSSCTPFCGTHSSAHSCDGTFSCVRNATGH
eukprot:6021066-Amphidinium_carterae.1